MKRQTDKILTIAIVIGIIIIFIGFIIARIYIKDSFQYETIINGIDCSFLNINDSKKKLETNMNNAKIKLIFAEEKEYTCLGAYFNIQLDNTNVLKDILLEQKNKSNKKIYNMQNLYKIDEQKVKEYLYSLAIFSNGNSDKEPINAYLNWNEEKKEFYIEKEVLGNKLNIDDAYNYMLTSLRNGKTIIDFREITDITPEITANNLELKKQMEEINSIVSTTVEYKLYDGTAYTLNYKKMKNWISRNKNNEYIIDLDKNVPKFVNEIAKKSEYELISTKFNATGIGEIKISFGRKTYAKIDKEKEIDRLKKQLKNKENASWKVIYKPLPNYTNLKTYIELDLSRQRVWMYVDGECILNTPCVTGNVSQGYSTPVGIYYLTYKTMNTTLEGYNYDGSTYSSPVTYWMPFNGGIGFHDATWRGSFGGNIYMTNGSHGCVNLPYWAASTIYTYINSSIPIIIY